MRMDYFRMADKEPARSAPLALFFPRPDMQGVESQPAAPPLDAVELKRTDQACLSARILIQAYCVFSVAGMQII
jgi:hypothetical protein